MNNLSILRKTLIALLAIATVIVIILVVKNMTENGTPEPSDTAVQKEPVEIKSTTELIAEQKFALIELNEDGFSENSVTVPLGGVLQITNNTTEEVTLDIRAENYVAGLTVGSNEVGFSPVFTQAGQYTMSEFIDGEINEEISTKVSVVK